MSKTLTFVLLLLLIDSVSADSLSGIKVYSYEDQDDLDQLNFVGTGKVSISQQESYHGESSLRWQANHGDSLGIRQIISTEDIFYEKTERHKWSVTTLWIHNEIASKNTKMRVNFYTNDKLEQTFELGMNFYGWNCFWVPFKSMDRQSNESQYDRIEYVISGKDSLLLHLDLLTPYSYVDRRYPLSGENADFIFSSQYSGLHSIDFDSFTQAPKQSEILELEKIATKIENSWKGSSGFPPLESIKSRMRPYDDNPIIWYYYTQDPYIFNGEWVRDLEENTLKLRDEGKLLLNLAKIYLYSDSKADKGFAKESFIKIIRAFLKSGLQYGNAFGTRHHMSYYTREFILAAFLMRNELAGADLLEEVSKSCLWFSWDFLDVFNPDTGAESMANLDYYNTASKSHLMSILMIPDKRVAFNLLKLYRDYLSLSISARDHSVSGGFKEDGSAYHHWGHYPAYLTGALNSLASVFEVLANTEFEMTDEAYKSFGDVLYATNIYTNGKAWPRGISGRHPYGGNIEELKSAYLNFARSGAYDWDKPMTRKVGMAFNRLWDSRQLDLEAEENPQGFFTFPYSGMAIYRLNDLMVSFKGYSKYVWAHEIYGRINKYGRYQSHGAIEIIPSDGWSGSRIGKLGWDWNKNPGTTTHELPWNALAMDTVISMSQSEESFLGGVHLNHELGLFAVKLNESSEDGGHGLRANKSAFAFNGQILCMGSHIKSDADYPVQTTLFQQELRSVDEPVYIEKSLKKLSQFPSKHQWQDATLLKDLQDVAYYIPDGHTANLKRSKQQAPYHYQSPNNKIVQFEKTDADTLYDSNYATAWIEHGTRPRAAKYWYMMKLHQTSAEDLGRWVEKIENNNLYRVVAHNDSVHAVYIPEINTSAYAFFEPDHEMKYGLLKKVSEPCLIVMKNQKDKLRIVFSDPDLRFAGGENIPGKHGGELVGEFNLPPTGIKNAQKVTTITLEGTWNYPETSDRISVRNLEGRTEIYVTAERGRSYEIILTQ